MLAQSARRLVEDAGSLDDTQWFKTHPEATMRLRAPLPGEIDRLRTELSRELTLPRLFGEYGDALRARLGDDPKLAVEDAVVSFTLPDMPRGRLRIPILRRVADPECYLAPVAVGNRTELGDPAELVRQVRELLRGKINPNPVLQSRPHAVELQPGKDFCAQCTRPLRDFCFLAAWNLDTPATRRMLCIPCVLPRLDELPNRPEFAVMLPARNTITDEAAYLARARPLWELAVRMNETDDVDAIRRLLSQRPGR